MPRAEFRKIGRRARAQLVHALAPRQGPAALHARRDDRRSLRAAARRSASATRSCSCCARRRTRCRRSTRRTSGSSRAATSTTPRCGSSTPRRRWRRSRSSARGLLADREVIPQALKLNPAFFKTIYTDLLNAKKTTASVSRRRSTRSIATSPSGRRRCSRRSSSTCARSAKRARAREIEDHFTRHFDVERRDDGVRVPGRPGADRQGVDAGRG